MLEFFSRLSTYFQYPFVRYAMVVSLLIALCSSLLGVTLVLKRFSFIGDGLSHVAFGVLAVATALGLTNSIVLVLPATIVCAVLLLRTGQNSRIRADAAIAMLSVGALAIGYLVMNLFAKTANLAGDVCATLFGSTSILTLTKTELGISIVLSVVVITFFVLFYNKLFVVTFDEDYATATGINAKRYNLVVAIVIAVVVVLAMNLVGALLISALVVFPALTAMRIFQSYRAVTLGSVVFALVCTTIGMLLSIAASTPVGATIVAVDVLGFISCSLVSKLT